MKPTHQINLTDDAVEHLGREWLLTNGTGAYAMGTLPGVNTRRYHGLLVAATRPPVGRVVALSQMLERLTLQQPTGRRTVEFTSCTFRDHDGKLVHSPRGLDVLRRFDKGLSVAWAYVHGHVTFVRELFLHWKEQAVTLRYRISGLGPDETARLCLHPMIALRDFHSLLRHADGGFDVQPLADHVTLARGDVAMTLSCPGAAFQLAEDWWRNLAYPVESERGQDDREDLFLPGFFEINLPGGQASEFVLTVALGRTAASPQPSTAAREKHLAPMLEHVRVGDEATARMLGIAADDFVVDRTLKGKQLSTILAGYPWFADWGRDTFIAMEGLLLCTGRHDEARATLQVFAEAIKDGLIPNRFDDYDEAAAHYNTVDASLWFVHAAIRYRHVTGDNEAWRNWLAPAARSIIDAYLRGTRYDIRAAGDGLITAGNARTQLTWMDAACGDTIFTPRHGKAVEINALWHHVLIGMSQLLRGLDDQAAGHYDKLAGRIKRSYARVFWDNERDYLVDHVHLDGDGQAQVDRTLRPNQLLAVSLEHSPLPRTTQRKILDAAERHLLTPFGPRTLPQDDPCYHGRYTGSPFQRDEAYHQGTVWPWLIGPYAEGVLRVGRFSAEARQQAREIIAPLLTSLMGEGPFPSLGQLHEIHEADSPHRPVGCMAQAWSVAEVLRVATLIESK